MLLFLNQTSNVYDKFAKCLDAPWIDLVDIITFMALICGDNLCLKSGHWRPDINPSPVFRVFKFWVNEPSIRIVPDLLNISRISVFNVIYPIGFTYLYIDGNNILTDIVRSALSANIVFYPVLCL